MKISIIAAIASENRAIGKDNKLLWYIPEDLGRFKKLTAGHPVIMGRKTFESLVKPLVDRINIVITSDQDYRADGAIACHSLEEAIKVAFRQAQGKKNEVFIIGGSQIYKQAIDLADKLYLTIVDGDFEADTFFPDFSDFKKVVFEKIGHSGQYKYKFVELERLEKIQDGNFVRR